MRKQILVVLAATAVVVVIDHLGGIRTSLGAISKLLSEREYRDAQVRRRARHVRSVHWE